MSYHEALRELFLIHGINYYEFTFSGGGDSGYIDDIRAYRAPQEEVDELFRTDHPDGIQSVVNRHAGERVLRAHESEVPNFLEIWNSLPVVVSKNEPPVQPNEWRSERFTPTLMVDELANPQGIGDWWNNEGGQGWGQIGVTREGYRTNIECEFNSYEEVDLLDFKVELPLGDLKPNQTRRGLWRQRLGTRHFLTSQNVDFLYENWRAIQTFEDFLQEPLATNLARGPEESYFIIRTAVDAMGREPIIALQRKFSEHLAEGPEYSTLEDYYSSLLELLNTEARPFNPFRLPPEQFFLYLKMVYNIRKLSFYLESTPDIELLLENLTGSPDIEFLTAFSEASSDGMVVFQMFQMPSPNLVYTTPEIKTYLLAYLERSNPSGFMELIDALYNHGDGALNFEFNLVNGIADASYNLSELQVVGSRISTNKVLWSEAPTE